MEENKNLNKSENVNENAELNNSVEMADANSLVIQKIMEKAITDEEFKNKLLEDPDSILSQYELSEIAKIMIKSLSREDYDKLTPENITEYFSADSAIYTPDFEDSLEVDYADEDEI